MGNYLLEVYEDRYALNGMYNQGAILYVTSPLNYKCNCKPRYALCGRKGEASMPCTEAYREHIMYQQSVVETVIMEF